MELGDSRSFSGGDAENEPDSLLGDPLLVHDDDLVGDGHCFLGAIENVGGCEI